MAVIKILIVEDDANEFESMKVALGLCEEFNDAMFFVERAQSVAIANQLRRIEKYDLFIVDYHLNAAETGLDLVRQIFSRDRHAAMILYSIRDGLVLDPEALSWVASGKLTFLHKSEFRDGPLQNAISKVLGRELRLLIVEDDPEDYELARLELSHSAMYRYVTDRAANLQEALDRLQEPYDAIIIDIRLGAESGLDLVRDMVANGIDIPIVLITGESDINLGEEMIRQIGRRQIGFLSKREMSVNTITHTLQRVAGSRLH